MSNNLKDAYIKSYWMYYLKLEKRLERTEEYVAFDEVNNKAYSIEYLALLQAICSEVDVVGKAIACHFDLSFDARRSNIQKWGYEVQTHLSGITETDVSFMRDRMLRPWKEWVLERRTSSDGRAYVAYASGCRSPVWWNAYNRVKHARTTIDDGRVNYHLANQKNVILALAGLFVLHRRMLMSLDSNAYGTMERSRLFSIPGRSDEVRMGAFIDSSGRYALYAEKYDG